MKFVSYEQNNTDRTGLLINSKIYDLENCSVKLGKQLPSTMAEFLIGEDENIKKMCGLFYLLLLKEIINSIKQLDSKIRIEIKRSASPRHVPNIIYKVKEIPRTISGKKVEIAVTKISNGEKVRNKDALLNPKSLNEYKKLLKKNIKWY